MEVLQREEWGRGTVRLISPFAYDVGYLGSGETIEVPIGFETDFCSVPRWARGLISTFDRGAKAAVLHDFLWSQPKPRARSRREIDRIYREAMAVLQLPFLRRWVIWTGVRWQALMTGDR